ncbi:hypothetical protein Tco_0345274 [Tanacetum coccineum]
MNSPPNHEWEEGLDIDDSDLLLTPVIRPTNNTHIVPEITTTQTLQVDNCVVKPIRIIPGPAGIVQTTKLRKLVDTREGGEESVMSTQEYIRKVIEDVGEDDDFTRAPWLRAIDYVTPRPRRVEVLQIWCDIKSIHNHNTSINSGSLK